MLQVLFIVVSDDLRDRVYVCEFFHGGWLYVILTSVNRVRCKHLGEVQCSWVCSPADSARVSTNGCNPGYKGSWKLVLLVSGRNEMNDCFMVSNRQRSHPMLDTRYDLLAFVNGNQFDHAKSTMEDSHMRCD